MFLITDKCVGCSACEIVCPVDAISEEIFATLHWHKARTMAAGVSRPEWALGPPRSS